jgi:nephrocystin-3
MTYLVKNGTTINDQKKMDVYDKVGTVFKNKGDYVKALQYYEECLQIKQKVKGKDSIDCASTLKNIGLVFYDKGDYVKALQYYEECF